MTRDIAMLQATRLRMPAEWTSHERTLMSWPVNRAIWGGAFEQARDEYAATAQAIAHFEPVLMIVNPGDEGDAAQRCGPKVEVLSAPINDSWMRDCGPIIVRGEDGSRMGIHFRFNAYGGRFAHDRDAPVGGLVLEHLKIPKRESALVLEGGSITVDGEGTLIATEQCLLNANRNPAWTRVAIEQELCAQFGVERVIWLRWGRAEDAHTDGHVDLVCMFVRPGAVVAQACEDPSDANHDRMASNLATLRAATDAHGRPIEIITLPLLPLVEIAGRPTMVSNANFYFVNGGLIVPVAGTAGENAVLDILRRACPDREVVGVPAGAIALGGGGVHCITQQIPAAG
jgi:agmatine deiminase